MTMKQTLFAWLARQFSPKKPNQSEKPSQQAEAELTAPPAVSLEESLPDTLKGTTSIVYMMEDARKRFSSKTDILIVPMDIDANIRSLLVNTQLASLEGLTGEQSDALIGYLKRVTDISEDLAELGRTGKIIRIPTMPKVSILKAH